MTLLRGWKRDWRVGKGNFSPLEGGLPLSTRSFGPHYFITSLIRSFLSESFIRSIKSGEISYGKGQDLHKGYNLVAWPRVCRLMKDGGFGVLNLQDMNRALLAKWWGRLCKQVQSKTFGILIRKYGSINGVWFGRPHTRSRVSSMWKSISGVREPFLTGTRAILGDGRMINF